MYAIVEVGGRQWRVEEGTYFHVNRLEAEVGAEHTLDQVLLTKDGDAVSVGQPFVDGAKVVCDVAEHSLGKKVVHYHYSPRENTRTTRGHRQKLTKLVVKKIKAGK